MKKDLNTLWSNMYFEGREKGYYKIVPTTPGSYSFCFNNQMSRFTPKTVQFDFFVNSDPVKNPNENIAKPGRYKNIMNTKIFFRGFESYSRKFEQNQQYFPSDRTKFFNFFSS